MQATEKPQLLTVEEYLEGEQHSEIRHEFIAGVVSKVFGLKGGAERGRG